MKIAFEPRDLWVGLFWRKCRITTLEMDTETYTFFICIVPCFPIVWKITRNLKP